MADVERIWARLDTATVYMDGSSPLVARNRSFPRAAEYFRADIVAEIIHALTLFVRAEKMARDGNPPQDADELIEIGEAAIAKATGSTPSQA